MKLITEISEEAVIDRLQEIGPCQLDDLILSLPYLNWASVVATVDFLSRKGQVLFRDGIYDVIPSPQRAPVSKVQRPINRSAEIPYQVA